MAKDCTLIGYLGRVAKEIDNAMKSDNAPIATTSDVKAIINEMVTKTFLNSVSAVSKTPTTATIAGKEFLFANGTPIKIVEREDGVAGAKVIYDGGEILVSEKTKIFGGCHDDDTLVNSDITFEGGTIGDIYGGGLHKSHTVKAKITMLGGTTTSVNGGAADQLVSTCTCNNRIYEGPIEESWAQVEDIEIVIKGGTVKTLLYGGGMGYSRETSVKVVVDGGDITGWTTSSGANGYTDTASLVINGGKFNVVQGINRGTVENVSIVVNDGEINKLFVGGEIPFAGTPEKPNANDPHGTFKSASCTINGGTIGEFSLGGNSYAVIEEGAENVIVVDNR